MGLLVRYSDRLRGNIVFIGNTLGLSRRVNQKQPGRECVAGAFVTTENTVCNAFPINTTCNYLANRSEAILELPAGAEVVYAEIIWAATAKTAAGTIEHAVNNSILFTTPAEDAAEIAPAPDTRFMEQMVAGTSVFTYIRSAIVTDYVKAARSGTYAVGRVPAFLDANDSSSHQSGCAGWTLAVIYRDNDDATPYRQIALYVGSLVAMQYQEPAVARLTGFTAPDQAEINARLLVSAAEGDYSLRGDQLFFGTIGNANFHLPLSGPNNPARNFFASQINDSSGELKTTGTFGTRNHYRVSPVSDMFIGVSAGRQGWDITSVGATGHIDRNKDSALLKIQTKSDSVFINGAAIVMDIAEPNAALTLTKSSEELFVTESSVVHYQLKVANTGDTLLTDILVTDVLPAGLILNRDSVAVDGYPPDGALDTGIKIKQIIKGEFSMITYQAAMATAINSCNCQAFENKARATATYTVADQQYQICDSDKALVDCICTNLTKESNVDTVRPGSTIQYTIRFYNCSSVPLTSVKIADTLPTGLTLVQGSIVPAPQAGETLQTGVSVGTVAIGATVTLQFSATVNAETTGSIVNTATATFLFRDSGGVEQSVTSAPASNTIEVISPDLSITKTADRTFVTASGDEVIYTLVVKNPGTVQLTSVVVADTIPAGMSYKANSTIINGGTATNQNPANGITIGTLAPLASSTIQFTFIVD